MPQYVLNRNYTLRTTVGCSFTFTKNVPLNIPAIAEQDVIAIGGERVDGAANYVTEAAPKPSLSQSERDKLITMAFEEIVKRNDAKEFTATGMPSVRAVAKVTGFTVERTEVDELWTEYKALV